MSAENEVIEEYSEILERIYIFKTRGDFTFTGVLYEFLKKIDEVRLPLPLPSGDSECCASGRCEVCTPGYIWGRDG